MLKLYALMVAAGALLGATAAANADTVFDVSGMALNSSGGSLGTCGSVQLCPFGGTITVNTITGTLDAVDIMFPGLLPFDSAPMFLGGGIQGENSDNDLMILTVTTNPLADSLEALESASITVGSTSSTITFNVQYSIESGTIFLPAATPLPATLPLFAGGLGFVGYLAKRRKQNAKQALVAA